MFTNISLKDKIIHGIIWQILTFGGNHLITFVISVSLTRMLEPSQFGTVALTSIFLSISNVIVDFGLGTALIQKKEVDDIDCSSVFYLNITLSCICYTLIFLLSSRIASFYQNSELTKVFQIIGLSVFINALSGIQNVILNKKMLFHLTCKISWGANIPSGIFGVVLAYKGYGIWALVGQHISKSIINACLLWYLVKWRPLFCFSFNKIQALVAFGWKMFCSTLLSVLDVNLYGMLIGKLYNVSTLSYYQKGQHLPEMGMSIVNTAISGVLFPAFSSINDDPVRTKAIAQKGIINIYFIVTPMMFLMAMLAKPIIIILFTKKWIECVFFAQISCFIFFFWPLHTMNLQIITASGRSNIFLVLEVIKKIQSLLVILITFRYGVKIMVSFIAIFSFVSFIENAWCNRKIISYSFIEQLRDICPYITFAALLTLPFFGVKIVFHDSLLTLFIGVFVYLFSYLFFCYFGRLIPAELSEFYVKIMSCRTKFKWK